MVTFIPPIKSSHLRTRKAVVLRSSYEKSVKAAFPRICVRLLRTSLNCSFSSSGGIQKPASQQTPASLMPYKSPCCSFSLKQNEKSSLLYPATYLPIICKIFGLTSTLTGWDPQTQSSQRSHGRLFYPGCKQDTAQTFHGGIP